MPLESGAILGPYSVQRKLGAGGMGEVYVAADPRLGREVAVKVLSASLVREPESLKRFQQEALAVAALNHPNIVHIYDVGTAEDGSPYLVMELLEGESLRARMGNKPMPVRKVAEIGAQIARALGAAHGKGIIHRDLKPENVYLTKQGPVKILDFGLAKLAARPASSGPVDEDATRAMHTQVGMVLGTIGYMSPEQVQGKPVDARADLFALGVLLWEMLSGSRPFHGDSAIDTMHAILRQDPPEIDPELGLPPAMERLLRRCLEKDPDARFQSAQDLAFQLESLAVSSGMSKTKLVAVAEGGELPWYRIPHKRFYPLPIGLPQKLKVCFWDRIQLSALYLLLAGLVVFALLAPRRFWSTAPQATFAPAAELMGSLQSAAISRDGKHMAYSVLEPSGIPRLFYREGADIRAVREVTSAPATEVLAIADTGAALLKDPQGRVFQMELGKDALASQLGTRVLEADLLPDGTKVALLRGGPEGYAIEFPAGRVCYQSKQKLRDVRISPKGDAVAFLEQQASGFLFQVKCWRSDGSVESWKGGGILSPRGGFFEGSLRGMAWKGTGDGLYLVAQGNLVGLATPGGEQALHRNAGDLRLHGATGDGLLLEVGAEVAAARGKLPGDGKEQDLSWVGGTVEALSGDGSLLVVSRDREIWVLPANRSLGRKVGVGRVEAFSQDGKTLLYSDGERVVALPATGGDLRTVVTAEELQALGLTLARGVGTSTRFTLSDDGQWVLVHAGQILVRRKVDGSGVLERMPLALGDLQPEWRIVSAASPDGRQVALQVRQGSDGSLLVSLDEGKETARIPAERSERLLGWRPLEGFLVVSTEEGKGEVRRVDPKGQRRMLHVMEPPMNDASGRFRGFQASGDGAFYAYRYAANGVSQLVLGKGW